MVPESGGQTVVPDDDENPLNGIPEPRVNQPENEKPLVSPFIVTESAYSFTKISEDWKTSY